MSEPVNRSESLLGALSEASNNDSRFIWDDGNSVCLGDFLKGTFLRGQPESFCGKSVLIRSGNQLATALAMIELDGVVRQMIICPPDLDDARVLYLLDTAQVDAVVSEPALSNPLSVPENGAPRIHPYRTEWVLLTSGTTGAPKMVAHTFESLTAPIQRDRHAERDTVWGTFYDIRRYGGLQVFLRAILGNGSLVLSNATESTADHLHRLSSHSITHLSGTPSHWRRALMSPAAREISPDYVRLSGEIADQAILNMLHSFYPQAAVGHAFASTEAGVAFEVNDGLEGFPSAILQDLNDVEVTVRDSSLCIRSSRTATRFIGPSESVLKDEEDFVDTGDIVELRNGRYYFLGRRNGVINVGGLKVYPEEIESFLNLHPAVGASCVRGQKSPITGSLVVADVVLKPKDDSAPTDTSQIKTQILGICRNALPRHKVPAIINFVSALRVESTGKMARQNA
jgi:acyl-coenzyme A synthetase/AMP-(fatty) acid ligase